MTKRVFAGVAVEASAVLKAWLAELQRELPAERIRWVPPEKFHLTIEFFGEVDEARLPELAEALAAGAQAATAFKLGVGHLGTFGGARHPRVIWLGIESEGLQVLHDRVATALQERGWRPEARKFTPHLTLGRIARIRDLQQFQAAIAPRREAAVEQQAVRELILYETVPGRYVPLGRWPLRPADG